MDSIVLLLILVELLWVSLHLIWSWLLFCCMLLLLCLDMLLVSLISPRRLSWRGVGFFQWFFSFYVFPFSLFIWWITLMDFHMLNHLYISGINWSWLWWIIFWCVLGICLPVFYLVFLHLCLWLRLICNSLSWLSLFCGYDIRITVDS